MQSQCLQNKVCIPIYSKMPWIQKRSLCRINIFKPQSSYESQFLLESKFLLISASSARVESRRVLHLFCWAALPSAGKSYRLLWLENRHTRAIGTQETSRTERDWQRCRTRANRVSFSHVKCRFSLAIFEEC